MNAKSKTTGGPLRILAVAGARPNFMKIAPLVRELDARRERFETILCHTGQHYDHSMSEGFFQDLGIRAPDVNLAVGSGSHGRQTAEVLAKIEALMLEAPPDAVLVVGDVNSTIAAGLAAAKLHVPIAHVEAGLRSYDRGMPEEINRVLTDAISEWLFTTERGAAENLAREGIPASRIHFVGNVMIDTLLANRERARQLDTLSRIGVADGEYALLTLHRPSNVDDPVQLRRLFDVLEEIHRELPIVFPCHPRTHAAIEALLGGAAPSLKLIEPQGYLDFLRLMDGARLVLTDSGGIQEETTALGVTCLTLRDTTERPITVTEGTNTVVGTDPEAIRKAFREAMRTSRSEARRPELWDGKSAIRIVDVLERDLEARAGAESAA